MSAPATVPTHGAGSIPFLEDAEARCRVEALRLYILGSVAVRDCLADADPRAIVTGEAYLEAAAGIAANAIVEGVDVERLPVILAYALALAWSFVPAFERHSIDRAIAGVLS